MQKDLKAEALVITEEERNNPVFNLIYKRIRNLNKKLTNIQTLSNQDPETLKPEQKKKIKTKQKVEEDIKKN